MPRIISHQKKVEKKQEEKEKIIRRLLWLLAAVVLLLAVMLILPLLQKRESKAEGYACTLAIRKAQDTILVEFLSDPTMSVLTTAVVVDRSKLASELLCPSGGDYYLVPEGDGWRVTCGLHEENTILRTRINASRVKDLLQEQLDARSRVEMNLDADVEMIINGQPLDVIHVAGDNGLRRGTDYSIDFDGVVSFFSLNPSGEINWFVYADENHAAVWRIKDGWSGDAYPTY